MTRDSRFGQDLVRSFAQIVGVVLLLLGVLGLVLGDQSLGGLLNIDLIDDLFHLITGAVLAYAGFALRDRGALSSIVATIGVVYVVVGVLGFVSERFFGLLPSGYTVVDNVIHLAVGVLGIGAVWLTGRGAGARPQA